MTIRLFARGVWKVSAPYVVNQTVPHTCVAIRSFRELEAEGIGVFEQVYQPVGLTRSRCEEDRLAAVSIITLEREDGPNKLVPSSFITEYPFATLEGFSRVVLAVEIGLLSDKVPLDFLKEHLQQAVQDVIGIQGAEVELLRAPYSGIITPEQAELLEMNRQAAIAGGSNAYAENKRMADALAVANEKIGRLEQIIIDNAIIV